MHRNDQPSIPIEKLGRPSLPDPPGPVPTDDLVQRFSGSPRADDYVAIGDRLLEFLIGHAGLEPHHKVLDVGCGIGLAARPLTAFLSQADGGSYTGFDVVREPIEWCRAQYRRFPHFRFEHANVYNKHYNPHGPTTAREYVFPYDSSGFDVIVLTSVFTHLLPADLEHYLAEISRVLKPAGRCVITYFLLNTESRAAIGGWLDQHPDQTDRGVPGGLGFRWEHEQCCRLYSREVPETAVAYDEDWLRRLYRESGLEIRDVHYGEWCRRSFQPGWQDLVLAAKS